ncbi:MAG TPA: hypothetical protein VD968_02390 [Pyrinomonadaceae bacterium]|nr:hypothetical protein [Pyrinomonadaceae bacterium]
MRTTPGLRRQQLLKFNTRTLVKLLLLAAAGLSPSCALTEEKPRPTEAGWAAFVETIAGDGTPGFADAPAGAQARFREPFGVAVGADGSVFVSDAGKTNAIRKLSPRGEVSTLAGGREGFADGAGAAASFDTPSGLAVDADGNLYVADTGNNRVRKVTPEGTVSTLAGDGTRGSRDGPAAQAQFDAPLGVAVDNDGNVYVADTYNDRVRLITKSGEVKTIAGAAGGPSYSDGDALGAALFDTPCAVAVAPGGELFIADTGNNRVRRLTKEGEVITVPFVFEGAAAEGDGAPAPGFVSKPVGLAVTHDGFLYVTEMDRGRVVQVSPDGRARRVAGLGPGFSDGDAQAARFNQPSGLALDATGSLVVADAANCLVRRVRAAAQGDAGRVDEKQAVAPPALPAPAGPLPRLGGEAFGEGPFPWPLDPQDRPHEVSATMGEVRGSYDTDDSRHHLHSGLDVFGTHGQVVRAVFEEKVSSPLPNWGFGGLNEGLRVGLFSYIHIRVGRDERDEMLDGTPFVAVAGADGKTSRVRVRRGTRVRVGDALGTINRMYHVHMNLGPPGAEINPLMLAPAGFRDRIAPTIEAVKLFDESGAELKGRRAGRLLLRGRVRVVVDAFDRNDSNGERRRLGLYKLGYQLLLPDGSPAPGFESPRVTIEFDRLPPDPEATKIAYADESGITVYGSARTRFLYELTNTVRDGLASHGLWDTSRLPPGDYTLRILASDFNGNEAEAGRDLPVTIEP